MSQFHIGTIARDATGEEEMRLYQQAARPRYDREPILGAVANDLDSRRLMNYFRDIRSQHTPAGDDDEAWRRLLINTGLMVEHRGPAVALLAVDGTLLRLASSSKLSISSTKHGGDTSRTDGTIRSRRCGRR